MSTLILLPDSLMSFAVWVDEVPIALIKWQGLSLGLTRFDGQIDYAA